MDSLHRLEFILKYLNGYYISIDPILVGSSGIAVTLTTDTEQQKLLYFTRIFDIEINKLPCKHDKLKLLLLRGYTRDRLSITNPIKLQDL